MEWLTHILGPVLVIVIVLFAVYRLRGDYEEVAAGRGWQIAGAVMICLAAAWRMITAIDEYGQWFVEDAYTAFDVAQWALLLMGLLFLVIGLSLRLDQWRQRSDDARDLQHRLSLMWDLQRQARQPYQLMALLEMVVQAITERLPGTAGAVFLVNQNKRSIVLAASAELSREDVAGLEHLEYRDNPVTQSLQMAEPGIFGAFEFVDREGNKVRLSRRSSLVLPLISGLEGVGAIVLLADDNDAFGQSEIRLLQPVAGWLAERVRATRLTRELNSVRQIQRRVNERQEELINRLQRATAAFKDHASLVEGVCYSLAGLFESESVHLVSLASGQLIIQAGSSELGELSENYRTALIEALDRHRPVVINQEAGQDTQRRVTVSTLVHPLPSPYGHTALVLRRSETAFDITQEDLQVVSVLAGLASVALTQAEAKSLDVNRRAGFRRILGLLRFDRDTPLEADTDFLVDQMAQILPAGSSVVAFNRRGDGSFEAASGRGFSDSLLPDFGIYPGEGAIGQAVADRQSRSFFGRAQVDRALEHYETDNREAFYRIFGEKGPPALMAVTPILVMDQVKSVVAAFIPDGAGEQQSEWERLITLAAGLFGFRQTIAELHRNLQPVHGTPSSQSTVGSFINQLNNHLSAIIGNAELARSRPELSGELNRHLQTIIDEAARAEHYMRSASISSEDESGSGGGDSRGSDLNAQIHSVLEPKRISDDLFMIGEHAREVDLRLRSVGMVKADGDHLKQLIEGLFKRLSGLADEDQRMTVSTYRWGEYVYLDISRHGSDEPAAERLADLVEYHRTGENEEPILDDHALGRMVSRERLAVSVDARTRPPRYLSFRFRRVRAAEEPTESKPGTQLLVIDDQAMILDLITAMGQSLGYEVTTTRSPEEGEKLALDKDFDIVLLDLAMPGRSGLDLAGRLHRQKPRLPIILMTGWEVAVSESQRRQSGIREVLHKPFRIEQLTAVLRAAGRNLAIS
jgi:CheY-like chemotaxis protein